MLFSSFLRTLGISILLFTYQTESFRQFFGMLGPNVRIKTIQNLFDVFTGDGVIQSAFFDNSTICPQFNRHIIETDNINSRRFIPKWLMHYALYKMRFVSKNNGVANTALLTIPMLSNSTVTMAYALFERDMPYLIQIDHISGKITTMGRVKTSSSDLLTMSGHTKRYSKTQLETVDYHLFSKKVMYHRIKEVVSMKELVELKSRHAFTIKTRYLPVIHDFATTDDSIIITDSPLVFDFPKLLYGKLPVRFNKNAPTLIHVLNQITGKINIYSYPGAFYLFHYESVNENDTHIEIMAPLYDDLDFSSIDIHGKYRKIIIHKRTRIVEIRKNPYLENLNLDFPVPMDNDRVLFRNICDRVMNGFVIVDRNMTIIQTIPIPTNYSLCGEPGYAKIGDSNKIIAFLYDKDEAGYFYTVHPISNQTTLMPMNMTVILGFHSLTL